MGFKAGELLKRAWSKMPKFNLNFFIFFLLFGLLTLPPDTGNSSEDHIGRQEGFGLGRLATSDEVKVWDIDITPNGGGLPPGRGTVLEGSLRGNSWACLEWTRPGDARGGEHRRGPHLATGSTSKTYSS